ncbi:hypothetical protein [Candidatus Poriferisodalis sp.]|uniref:hypothetical protein n=1 Tax=Candidatus Poriferisodalis sp. TaxID=3101277 RepID=UPI003B5B9DB6
MDSYELRAARLLIEILGGTWREHDTGSASGLHDFGLRLDDDRHVAVEVTRDTSPMDRQFDDYLSRQDPIPADVRDDWTVFLDVPGDKAERRQVNDIAAQIVLALQTIESSHCPPRNMALPRVGRNFRTWRDQYGVDVSDEMLDIFRQLRIRELHRSPSASSTGGIRFEKNSVRVGSFDPKRDLAQLVDRHLRHRSDNVEKLRRARDEGADECHLFVWASLGDAHGAYSDPVMLDDNLDPLSFVVPEMQGIDRVWVALDSENAPIYICNGQRWTRVSARGSAAGEFTRAIDP